MAWRAWNPSHLCSPCRTFHRLSIVSVQDFVGDGGLYGSLAGAAREDEGHPAVLEEAGGGRGGPKWRFWIPPGVSPVPSYKDSFFRMDLCFNLGLLRDISLV
jgi:hypothetical protein